MDFTTRLGIGETPVFLQVMFWLEGEQPKLAIIFRGQGKHISQDEKSEWHKGVNVYFQPNPSIRQGAKPQ